MGFSSSHPWRLLKVKILNKNGLPYSIRALLAPGVVILPIKLLGSSLRSLRSKRSCAFLGKGKPRNPLRSASERVLAARKMGRAQKMKEGERKRGNACNQALLISNTPFTFPPSYFCSRHIFRAGKTLACENSRPSSLPARVAFRNATRAGSEEGRT